MAESNSVSITDFKNQVLGGKRLHSPNKFKVEIESPVGSLNNQYVTAVFFPGRNLVTQDEFLFGLSRRVPVAREYGGDGGLIIEFAVDESFLVRRYFEQWMGKITNKIVNPGLNVPGLDFLIGLHNARPDTTGNYKEYAGDSTVVIKALDSQGNERAGVTLIEPYPKAILPFNFQSASQNDFTRLQVTFDYKEYIFA